MLVPPRRAESCPRARHANVQHRRVVGPGPGQRLRGHVVHRDAPARRVVQPLPQTAAGLVRAWARVGLRDHGALEPLGAAETDLWGGLYRRLRVVLARARLALRGVLLRAEALLVAESEIGRVGVLGVVAATSLIRARRRHGVGAEEGRILVAPSHGEFRRGLKPSDVRGVSLSFLNPLRRHATECLCSPLDVREVSENN
mmetsp:Transcript_104646/g.281239  ORF Transcript_104646/g.281239 Transcript_104646/m.281239 type:complete len:200 (-) Transcript_104646:607-1206(-)